MLKKIGVVLACGISMAAYAEASEQNQNPWMVRLRGIEVVPYASSSTITGIGGQVDRISNAFVPELDISYFFNPHVSTELILGTTRHSVTATNTALGNVDLGHVNTLPPTLTVQYHFTPEAFFDPYVGVGINYTMFYNVDPGPVADSIDYSNSFGPAVQLGADFRLDEHWFFNIDVKKIWIKSDVHVNALGQTLQTDVNINPVVYGAGVGYHFG